MSSEATVVLHRSPDLEVTKNLDFPEYLYLIQDGSDVIELNESDARALFLILKNRFED